MNQRVKQGILPPEETSYAICTCWSFELIYG
jgi:hypothetical protein